VTKVKKGTVSVDLRGSLFCEVREPQRLPLCGFYVSAIHRILELFGVSSEVRVEQCRAEAPGQRGCRLSASFSALGAGDPVSV
jgi:hypothetical protein